LLNYADAVLVPLNDSPFDREAAAACIAELRAHPRVATGRVRLGVVGMRVDSRTRGAQALHDWAAALDVPLVATLRATQQYVRGAEQGLTLFDLPPDRTEVDRAQWQPLLDWLKPVIDPPRAAADPRVPRLPTAGAGTSREPVRSVLRAGSDDVAVLSRPVAEATAAAPVRPPVVTTVRAVRSMPGPAAPVAPTATPVPQATGWRRVLSWLSPRPPQALRGPGP
ncbi:MAG: hypothetical protein ACK5V2_08305, partial [Pseudomonadota bacterium]